MKNFSLLFLSFLFSSFTLFAQNIDVQGHRGARGLYPENSIYGFIAAVEMGVTTLELDVVISKDGQVVVSHDPYLNYMICKGPNGEVLDKTASKKWNLYKMDYTEIENCDCGSIQHFNFPNQTNFKSNKPSLGEVISRVEFYIAQNNLPKVNYNIETKLSPEGDNIYHPIPEVFVDLVMDVVLSYKIEKRTIIQSFDARTIEIVSVNYPEVATAYLLAFSLNPIREIEKLNFKPSIFSPNYQIVNEKVIFYCKENNMKIIPWTVNDKTEMIRLIDLGVDGIISDYPNLVIDLLNQ